MGIPSGVLDCAFSPRGVVLSSDALFSSPIQGRKFHAHRIALLASSDAFHAMFSGGYREKEASSVEIPNIPWDVFESMMRYIYTGNVEVQPELANELLQASDQYLLDGKDTPLPVMMSAAEMTRFGVNVS